jgi:phage baseplate assembly protein V
VNQALMRHLRSAITRGRIVKAALNPKRTLLQISGVAGETKQKVELVMSHGRSALPKSGGDVILVEIGGSRSHVIALCGDDPALRIADLQEGEFGDRDYSGQQIVFRKDRLEITSPLKLSVDITGDADISVGGNATVDVGGDLDASVDGDASMDISGDADIDAATLTLCGGDKNVVLDGDPVSDGVVHSSASKVKAA